MASLSGNVLCAVALVAPPLAVFLPLGMAPLLAVAAVALFAVEGRRAFAAVQPFAGIAAWLTLLALWGMLSALWSPIPGHSLFEGARFLAIILAGMIILGAAAALGPGDGPRLTAASLIGLGLALLLLQIELRAGGPILHRLDPRLHGAPFSAARYDRGATVLLLAAWPALAALWTRGRRWGGILAALAVGDTLFLSSSHAAMLGAVLGIAVLPLARWRPRLVAYGLVLGVVLIAFVYPLAAPGGRTIERIHEAAPMLHPSAIHRLAIWHFTAARIADRPWLGWGMDASRALPGGKEPVDELMPALDLSSAAEALPLHPHDAPLQWRVELGWPGVLLVLAALVAILRRITAARAQRPLALGYAAAALAVAVLSFGAWQAWWLSTLWLTAAVMVGMRGAATSR